MDVLRAVSQMGEGFNYTIHHFGYKGVGYNNMLSDSLVDGDADIVVGDWTATAFRSEIVAVSYPYFDTGLKILRMNLEAANNHQKCLLFSSKKSIHWLRNF